jgi:hypothetical protein
MTASLDSEAEVRLTLHLPVSSQKSVNFEPAGYPLRLCRVFLRFCKREFLPLCTSRAHIITPRQAMALHGGHVGAPPRNQDLTEGHAMGQLCCLPQGAWLHGPVFVRQWAPACDRAAPGG